jgi:hypothetical protein
MNRREFLTSTAGAAAAIAIASLIGAADPDQAMRRKKTTRKKATRKKLARKKATRKKATRKKA